MKNINPQVIFNKASKLNVEHLMLQTDSFCYLDRIKHYAKSLLYAELGLCDSFDDVLAIKNYYRIKAKKCSYSTILLKEVDNFINNL